MPEEKLYEEFNAEANAEGMAVYFGISPESRAEFVRAVLAHGRFAVALATPEAN